MIKKYFLACALTLLGYTATANNLNIQNVSATATEVTFTVSWDNSWKMSTEPNNYDAVWIFIKAQNCESFDRAWKHSKINASGHTIGNSLLQVDPASDGMGVFIRRISDGFGSISNTVVTLKLQGTYPTTSMNFNVHGIEMVYVPSGSFTAGDGGSTYTIGTAGVTTPYVINSENALTAGDLRSAGTGTSVNYNPTIPLNFPKGFNAFYCMKYEITQGQYVSFLNSLNFTQQNLRTARVASNLANTYAMGSDPVNMTYRNGIRIQVPGNINQPAVYGMDLNVNATYNEAADGENIACNYLSWEDLKAYLDWSALRPMTELEYEKAGRGSATPVVGEKAWGNATVTYATSTAVTNSGTASELSSAVIAVGSGLCVYGNTGTTPNTIGPMRAGFAATQTSYRTRAGASFWGIMELSGNVFEQAFNIGYANANASGFTGVLGDGELDATGAANPLNWNGTINSTIIKGGSFASPVAQISISDRSNISAVANNLRHAEIGGRGVRQF